MSVHAHKWNEVGEREPVELARSACACGASRLELVHPATGRRVALVVPLRLMRAVNVAQDLFAQGKQAVEIGANLLDLYQRIKPR